ncbi:sulfur oxidation c-type cytochrome SoxX [Loktanella sp. SALINAS62]|uniref:sulfur oxidation c-type cytochrome SoxX n=1 Tax=Loktanella sp. SALINAS62 TaxID=2706124 RepID=UPI001B8C1128|nr:sulfur oxidation c-type cytochrome SoxX [Loktanella sp. SALINAS62]MBS1302037.1 sulfur oxidation c-type cytochrome SoxX [Loktanella sp. SALINAS62]
MSYSTEFAAVIAGCLATGAWAETVAPTAVAYGEYGEVEMSLTGAPGDNANGMVVMTNRGKGNCIACHQVTALEEFPFHGEVGPSLDGVADRWTESDLRGIVANAKMAFPGTMMPAFYKTEGYIRPGDDYTGKAAQEPLAPILTAQEVEDVVAYLMTLNESN